MKRHAASVAFVLLTLICLVAYAFHQQKSSGRGLRAGLREPASMTSATDVRVPQTRTAKAPEAATPAALEQAQRNRTVAPKASEPAARARARSAAPSPNRSSAEVELADSSAPSGEGGGDMVIVTPKEGCAPDSYIVQPCSLEDWTYTFPED